MRAHNQAYIHRQDYAYTSSCPESPKNTTKPKTLNLTCILNIQKHKPRQERHIKAYYNKQTKQTERIKA